MIKVGLTGIIGSGKSTVARIFEILKIPVYNADEEAKKILSDPDVITNIINRFGQQISEGNKINRKKLADIVFNDKDALHFLNEQIHPRVRSDMLKWMNEKERNEYVIHEAAILFESGFYKSFDKIIMVSCPEEIAIQRVIVRDGVTASDVIKRLKNQWKQEEKIERSDFIIHNDGKQLVLPQVLKIHHSLIKTEKAV